jgi:hypothetical protein
MNVRGTAEQGTGEELREVPLADPGLSADQ